jgi:hypothetical protein
LCVLEVKNEPMERYNLDIFLQQRQKKSKKKKKKKKMLLIFGHFLSVAVLCHTTFFAHTNKICCIRVS